MSPHNRMPGATKAAVRNRTAGDGLDSSTAPAAARTPLNGGESRSKKELPEDVTSSNPVVVVSRPGCCMSHAVTRLLCSLGVNPQVIEIPSSEGVTSDQHDEVPAIFIGGRLLGGIDRLLAAHISGSLIPQLKDAGALWL
ncbi:hypothetical protein KP509_26G017700 [Ceratopteris richardii]|uniref:Glutaredoxin domain-containing protein n=1 Tax=Ceratopteris richardii TaxID=49495 RepID=A0A8T2RKS7_CERRI|nr:hypothetical protein KP509_26G017700 [Ceratopteris richardii]